MYGIPPENGNDLKCYFNKTVLLRERKRHTARRVAVASACYSGGEGGYPEYPLLDLGWGTPPAGVPPSWGTPLAGVPPLPGPWMGYPPTWTWDGVPPHLDLRWGTPPTWTWDGVPPYL